MTRARIDRSNGHKPVTLQTIATELGVSTATVSLALRDIPAVALETREAVREAAKRLGYVYNRSAASLRSATTGIIGVALHDLANPFLVEVLVAVEKAAALQSRSVVVTSAGDDRARQQASFERFKEYRLDGVIVSAASGSTLEDFQPLTDAGVPITLIMREVRDLSADYVGPDHALGMRLALNYLHDLGHRRIALLNGHPGSSSFSAREDVFRLFHAERGLPLDPDLHQPGAPTAETGFHAAARLLTMPAPPTAAICFNDAVAYGALNGLLFAGREPGRDFSVVGFDDLKESALIYPGLTTIRSGAAEIGERATRFLLSRIGNRGIVNRSFTLRPELVIRKSTGPVAGHA
ncbi:MAG: LacI family DNA-binding transcriptional regulator [Labrys sp. (in: a-proteobacteria)]|jgi:LacI family transcriptional regulator